MTTAFRCVVSVRSTFTNWPGQSRLSLFSNVPLSWMVPVDVSTELLMNVSTSQRRAFFVSRDDGLDTQGSFCLIFFNVSEVLLRHGKGHENGRDFIDGHHHQVIRLNDISPVDQDAPDAAVDR